MPSCGNNMIAVGRPGKDAMLRAAMGDCNSCGSSDLGPLDPLNKNLLGPRTGRDKIREQIKDYIILKLGAPVLDLELDEQQLDLAANEALMVFEEYCPREYFQYYVFDTIPGKSVYTMPPDVGYIRQVYYKSFGTYAFQASDLGGALPIEYFNPGGAYAGQTGMMNPTTPIWGNMGEWALYKGYERMFTRLSSNEGGWEWVGGYQNIKIYPIPLRSHKVIVHYLQRQPDFQQVTQAMLEGGLIFAKEMLGRIRSRIKNPPGPNGGIQLDGDQLLAESREDKAKWEERLINRWGDLLGPSYG